MKSSDLLFHLINSLSKSEKRYFISKNKSSSVYIKLFRGIEKQSAKGYYDEKLIKEKHAKEKFVKQLTYTKNYLYELISESLIKFHRKSSIESLIYSLVLSAKIFFNKSLFEGYFRNIEKAKVMAYKYERFGIVLEIIVLQKQLIRAKDMKRIKLSYLQKEENEIFLKMKNLNTFSKLQGDVNILIKRVNNTGSRVAILTIENILRNKLLNSEKQALTIQAKDIYYDLKIFDSEFNGDFGTALKLLLKKRDNYIDNEEIFRINVNYQISTIVYNLAAYYLETGNTKEFEKQLRHYKNRRVNDSETDLIADLDTNTIFLRFLFLKRGAADFKRYAESVLEHLKVNESKITKDYLLSVYYNIALLYFNSGDAENSLNTLNLLFNHRFKNFRKDLLNAGRILSFFIHYDLENYDLLENILRSYKRNKSLTPAQRTVASYIGKLINSNSGKLRSILTDFRSDIIKLKNDRIERHSFRYFDPEVWIATKISL